MYLHELIFYIACWVKQPVLGIILPINVLTNKALCPLNYEGYCKWHDYVPWAIKAINSDIYPLNYQGYCKWHMSLEISRPLYVICDPWTIKAIESDMWSLSYQGYWKWHVILELSELLKVTCDPWTIKAIVSDMFLEQSRLCKWHVFLDQVYCKWHVFLELSRLL